jgi:hypothetical protein
MGAGRDAQPPNLHRCGSGEAIMLNIMKRLEVTQNAEYV